MRNNEFPTTTKSQKSTKAIYTNHKKLQKKFMAHHVEIDV